MLRDAYCGDCDALQLLEMGSVSVIGVKATEFAGPAAFVDFQTPPPVLPTYTVLPLESDGSTAMLVTCPVMRP